jgi:DUF1680 family protein
VLVQSEDKTRAAGRATVTLSRREFVGVNAAAVLAGLGATTGRGAPAVSVNGVKMFARYMRLPGTAITPEGWLGRYAEINANGWILKYAKERMPAVWGRYSHREEKGPADYGSYFGDALVRYAGLFPGSKVDAEARAWVAQIIASQDPDGYIGAFHPEDRWHDSLEIFSQSLLIDALLFHYECTENAQSIACGRRAADRILQTWYQPGAQVKTSTIFRYIGAEIVRTMDRLYAATGNPRYPEFALAVLKGFGEQESYLGGGDGVAHKHAVGEAEQIGFPAAVYECTGIPELLRASESGWNMLQKYMSVDGTPHGDESLHHVGSRMNSEHCGAADWIITNGELSRITGEVKYADALERALFNGYAAPVSDDGMMVAYMHAPNELVASEWSQQDVGIVTDLDEYVSRQYFSTDGWPLCCNSNGPRAIPYFIESMVLRSANELAVACYGPCRATANLSQAGQVKLALQTDYPFEDEVRVSLDLEHPALFAIHFRIPGWCSSAVLEVNGATPGAPVAPGKYATIERVWTRGDKVNLRFVNPIRVTQHGSWRDPQYGIRARCVTIERGPLVFRLGVPADWQPFEAPSYGMAPTSPEIKSYRLFAKGDAAWNYALIVDPEQPELSLTLKKLPVPPESRPFDSNPPIGLEAKARRVLNWRMEGDPGHPLTPGMPFKPMKLAEQVETVTLVPYGATRLRMTYLPVVPA